MKKVEDILNDILQLHYEHGLVVKEIHIPKAMKKKLENEIGVNRIHRTDIFPDESSVVCLFDCGQFLIVSEPTG